MELDVDDYIPIELESFYHNGNRYYILPKSGVAVPSVTTVLYKDVHFEETPNSIRARRRGTAVHDLVEAYLRTGSYPNGAMPINLDSANKIVDQLCRNVNKIHLVEGCLYSQKLMTAGRVDLLATWNGEHAVVDFKTSRSRKREEWLTDYYKQATVYGMMARDLYFNQYKFNPKKIVIIIANDEDNEAQVFVKNFINFKRIETVVKQYIADREDK
jgi:hypothetical protein